VAECGCGEPAVFLAEKPLCRQHFQEWLETQVFTELNRFVSNQDSLAVAASGGKDSTALLELVHEWNGRRKSPLPFSAILIDEGIAGYREFTRHFLEDFCHRKNINLRIVSFQQEFGAALDHMLSDRSRLQASSCTICGALRRYLLNRTARQLGATKLLLAHNLDDEVQTCLMNLFAGNVGQFSRKGELAGITDHPLFVVRFKPLIRVPEKAMTVYGLLNYPKLPDHECPYLRESLRFNMRQLANRLEAQTPGFKQSLMETYLSKVLPALKTFEQPAGLGECSSCGEPSSQPVCQTCEFCRKLGLRTPSRTS
jgi:uncharacterized protein (TIGR00269 family)